MKVGDLQYPKYAKRPVTIIYMSWKRYDPDAYHTIVEIIEFNNMKWDGKFWTYNTTQKGLTGRRFSNKFKTYKMAERWVKSMVSKHFSGNDYVIKIKDLT